MKANVLNPAVMATKLVLARLRFLAVFLAVGFVVGYWDDIKNHVDKWTRPAVSPDSLAAAAAGGAEYYCAMHPQIVRAEPGDCPICAMPLIKRKKGEQIKLPEDVLARVQLSPRRIALAGIGLSTVEARALMREIHAVGVLDYDETKVAQISVRVAGRADRLFLQYTGQEVRQGEPLYSLYSPDLYAAQREYLQARKQVNALPADTSPESRADASAVYNATMEKLVLWGVTRDQLDLMDQEFDRDGKVPSHLTVTSPISGIVVRKEIFEGGYMNVGDKPYTIADLNNLWLQAKIYERDVPLVQIGQHVQVTVDALQNETFSGTVAFRAFQIDPLTRTLDARIVVKNVRTPRGDLVLRPGMFADADIRVPVVPADAAATQPTTSQLMTPACAQAFAASLKPYLQAESLLSQDKSDNVANLLRQSLGGLDQLCEADRRSPAYRQLTEAVGKTQGQDLDALRESFKAISNNLIEIGKATGLPADAPAVAVFRCPMVKANWLQTASEVANPYKGSSMLTCGGPVETMPKADALAAEARDAVALGVGKALVIPRSAVIDTGHNRIVYVAQTRNGKPTGVFDMHAVRLGALAGDYYPVEAGLDAGDQVVTDGAFLIDAENHLNPGTPQTQPAIEGR